MNVSVSFQKMPAHAIGRYTVGVDFGTLSARALVVRVEDGAEIGSAVYPYTHGVIDRVLPGFDQGPEAVNLPPDWALQNPDDWTAALGECVPAALAAAGVAAPRRSFGCVEGRGDPASAPPDSSAPVAAAWPGSPVVG